MTIRLRSVALALLGSLGAMQLGGWSFLGLSPYGIVAGALAMVTALIALGRGWSWEARVSLREMALVMLVALAVLLVGGEGRWFYATPDWQVRYAVLRDLTVQPWPFAYATPAGAGAGAGAVMLRAPLGIYLGPALLGKLWGFHAAEQGLLAQNTLLLGMVLALGGALFDTGRRRLIALGLFWGFSGMDVIGQALTGRSLSLHLEAWAGVQFSSHMTQILWVPQHALGGWIFAVFYLLWRQGAMPVWMPLACVWLVGLLSPLALMGCVPFAAHALITGVARRELSLRDMGWLALIALLCVPGLLYLTASSGAVGAGQDHASHALYPLFILLEIGGYLVALWLVRDAAPFGGVAAGLVVAILLLAPFGQVGNSGDFTARASIPALAMLCLMVARIVVDPTRWPQGAEARRWVMAVWLIGLATPVSEVWRGIVWPPAPEVMCSYLGVVPGGAKTYTAPLSGLAGVIRPRSPALVVPHDPSLCWQGPWRDPIRGAMTLHHPY